MTIRNVPPEIWWFALIATFLTIIAVLWLLLGRARDEADGFVDLILESAQREACVTCFEQAHEIVTYNMHMAQPGEGRIILDRTDHEYLPGVLIRLTTDAEDKAWPPYIMPPDRLQASSVESGRRKPWRRVP